MRSAAAALARRFCGSLIVQARHVSSTARSSSVSFRPGAGVTICGDAPSDQRGFSAKTIS